MARRGKAIRAAATLPDLVVLALLAERPMHGYEIWKELARREVQDWAGVSRAQVYYSLAKTVENGWARPAADTASSGGPEREVVRLTAEGRAAAERSLDNEAWSTGRPPPPFLTWLCLSHLANRRSVARGIARRRRFLEEQIEKEIKTLKAIRADSGPMAPLALEVVDLAIREFKLEHAWLAGAERAVLHARGR